jgi:fatty-acyl-CoA synthase
MKQGTSHLMFSNLITQRAAAQSDDIALWFEGVELTYQTLELKSNQVAQAIINHGVNKQDRISILDANSVNYLLLMLGIAKSGAVQVSINTRLAGPEIAYILNDSNSVMLFVGMDYYRLIESIESSLSEGLTIIALDGGHTKWINFEQWYMSMTFDKPDLCADFDDDVIQLYTSGTTGYPKGVCHTHRTVALSAIAASDTEHDTSWANYRADTVNLVCLPLFHVAGFNLVRLTLAAGGKVVLTKTVDPQEILTLLPKHKVTHLFLVPTIIHMVVNHSIASNTDFSSLKCVSYGAAPIAESVLASAQKRFGEDCQFMHLYGMTENLAVATALPNRLHNAKLGKLRSCGVPYPGTQIKIVDAQGQNVNPFEVGEILVKCAWNMPRYWQNALATEEALKNNWLHTGDAGYIDEDGFLYIRDRLKDMIISGGENIYPAEVENAIFNHPDITDVAVIGVPDEKWGESVKAVVVLRAEAVLDAELLTLHARKHIAGFKVPRTWEQVDTLPRNASGKVLRRELRRIFSTSG